MGWQLLAGVAGPSAVTAEMHKAVAASLHELPLTQSMLRAAQGKSSWFNNCSSASLCVARNSWSFGRPGSGLRFDNVHQSRGRHGRAFDEELAAFCPHLLEVEHFHDKCQSTCNSFASRAPVQRAALDGPLGQKTITRPVGRQEQIEVLGQEHGLFGGPWSLERCFARNINSQGPVVETRCLGS